MKKIVSWSAIIFLALAVYLNVFLTLDKIENSSEKKENIPAVNEQAELKQQIESTMQQKPRLEPKTLLNW